MLSEIQKERLVTLRDLVVKNASIYDHGVFKSADGKRMCAAGLAVEHREDCFPGLGLKFDFIKPFGELAESPGYNIVTTDGYYCTEELGLYFGEGSWNAIFGLLAYGYERPTAFEVATNINRFLNKE